MPEFDLSFDAGAFSGEAPLFPLPNSVLLPGNLLPLHVFEPRYREMMAYTLARERYIGMALLEPGYEHDYQGNPAIAGHVCLGRVVMEEELPDGRWNLLLAGLRRARVVSEDHSHAFRLGRLEVIEDVELDDEAASARGRELATQLAATPPRLIRDRDRFKAGLQLMRGLPNELTLGALLDLVAEALELELRQRQRLLETADVGERAELLGAMVQARIAMLERLENPRPWPPRFSLN